MIFVEEFQGRYGKREGVLRLLFCPLTLLFTHPPVLWKTLKSLGELGKGKWSEYGSQFSAAISFCHLAYSVLAVNLDRYGRNGTSPSLGFGNMPMSRFFAHTLLSLYAHQALGPVMVLIGMAGWLAAHLVWIGTAPAGWTLWVILLSFLSTTFYANAFSRQNYNVLGWMLFPLLLYALGQGQAAAAAALLLAMSFVSLTVAALGCVLAAASALILRDAALLAAAIPAAVKGLCHLRAAVAGGEFKVSYAMIAKTLGLDRKAKYRFTKQYGVNEAPEYFFYYMGLYALFAAGHFAIVGQWPWLFLVCMALYLMNATVLRFADVQTFYMLHFSTAAMYAIEAPSPLMALPFWIMASPLPYFCHFTYVDGNFDRTHPYAPFRMKPLVEDMDAFFACMRKGERVLMCFEDPGTNYNRIYDGYMFLFQLALYSACRGEFNLLPDVWAVADVNYEGGPSLWGRTPKDALRNAEAFDLDYVVAYVRQDETLSPDFEAAGFRAVARFDWSRYDAALREEKFNRRPFTTWRLLKTPPRTAAASPEGPTPGTDHANPAGGC